MLSAPLSSIAASARSLFGSGRARRSAIKRRGCESEKKLLGKGKERPQLPGRRIAGLHYTRETIGGSGGGLE